MSDLVVVTGTSSGLGAAIARRLSADGFAVLGVSRREVDPETIGPGYVHICADLSDLDGIPALARGILRDHGTPFGLVNNAASGSDGLLSTMHNSEIRGSLELNLMSPLLLTKYLSRAMLSQRSGRVVNVSSIVARTGFRGLTVYAAAKAGIEGFTRSLARDLGRRGVTVNAVAPGFVETAMTDVLGGANMERIRARSPLERFVTPDEVAGAVAYLLSADGAALTGTVLTVDAGSTA